MIAIFKRELKSYFTSPIGYAFMGFFLLTSGLFFTVSNLNQANGSLAEMLSQVSYVFMVLVPVLTMRTLAEDRKSKADQMLLTAPVSVGGIVLGKYFAALCVFLTTLAITLVYPIILARYAALPFGEIFTGYLGFLLIGAAFIAVGVFFSALAENQVTAAASTFAALLAMYLMDLLTPSVSITWAASLMKWFSAYKRFELFVSGVLPFADIVYFISFIAIFLFVAVRAVERRRWSGG